ncbi:MAG: type II toxin-antitoxin system prevent-host-death family antitoxin [Candidatus Eremiobacteraeota bacterium]|nr:type II toxin-antitoxin system prevent-host-death family antitoxin [Candidatus Eremiobacteraeota bacterium]
MEQFSIAEAKKNLSRILGQVSLARATVEITKHGKPIARIVPIDSEQDQPPFKGWPGWVDDSDEFFGSVAEIMTSRHRPRVLDED